MKLRWLSHGIELHFLPFSSSPLVFIFFIFIHHLLSKRQTKVDGYRWCFIAFVVYISLIELVCQDEFSFIFLFLFLFNSRIHIHIQIYIYRYIHLYMYECILLYKCVLFVFIYVYCDGAIVSASLRRLFALHV